MFKKKQIINLCMYIEKTKSIYKINPRIYTGTHPVSFKSNNFTEYLYKYIINIYKNFKYYLIAKIVPNFR